MTVQEEYIHFIKNKLSSCYEELGFRNDVSDWENVYVQDIERFNTEIARLKEMCDSADGLTYKDDYVKYLTSMIESGQEQLNWFQRQKALTNENIYREIDELREELERLHASEESLTFYSHES